MLYRSSRVAIVINSRNRLICSSKIRFKSSPQTDIDSSRWMMSGTATATAVLEGSVSKALPLGPKTPRALAPYCVEHAMSHSG